MAIEAVPLLREDSILCWDIESTFKTAPAAATWQSLGRVEEWSDFGPKVNVFREAIAGSGREAASIGGNGKSYGPITLGPFQVVDPRFLGFAYGREPSAPSAIGATSRYEHSVTPTNAGRLPSMSIQAADYKAGARIDGNTFLGCIMPRLSLRGEATEENGSGGRILAAPTFIGHDDDPTVAAKAISIPTSEPYFFSHAEGNTFFGDANYRIHSWEATIDNHAASNYYHTSPASEKPTESPPEGITYDFRAEIVADGRINSTNASLIRDIVRNKLKGNIDLYYQRAGTPDWDYFILTFTNVVLESATKVRRRGKIMYDVVGYAANSIFKYADGNSARYFPA